MMHIDWCTGTPSRPDLYFVAIERGPYFGTYDVVTWDGEKWHSDHAADIVGFIAFTDFKSSLKTNWPKPLVEPPAKLPGQPLVAEWDEIEFDEAGDAKL